MAVNAKIASAYVDLVARTEAFEKALGDATSMTNKWSAQMREESEKSRAGIMMLSEAIGVHIPRHLQAVISKLPGVSSAMNMAFAATPILLAGKIIFETGEKIFEFAKRNEEAAQKSKEAWSKLTMSMGAQNDELDLMKAKLENTIAKLENKPQNKVKEAIAEAAVEADKLSAKMDQVITQIQGTLKAELPGTLSQILLKQTGGTKTAGVMSDLTGRMADINSGQLWGDPTSLQKIAIQDAIDKLVPIMTAAGARADELRRNGTPMEHSSSQKEYEASANTLAQLRGLMNVIHGSEEVSKLQATANALTSAKSDAAELSKAATEAVKKLEGQMLDWKARGWITNASNESDFWRVAAGDQRNPAARQEMTNRANAALAQYNQTSRAANVQNLDALNAEGSTQIAKERADQAEAARYAADGAKKAFESALRQIEAEERLRDATIKLAEKRGQLTPHEAAMALTTSHGMTAADFNGAVQAASAAGAQNLGQGALDFELRGQQQASQDALRELDTSWKGMINDVFDELRAKSRDTAAQIVQIERQFIDGMNSEAAKAITGQHANFAGVFQGAAQGLAKTGLEKIEGMALSALGLGSMKKADGSADSPFYVKMVGGNGAAGSGSPIAGFAAKGLLGMLNDNNWLGAHFGALFGAGGVFGGAHALGGDVMAGVPIDVGEMGRERFVPQTNGRIVPHNQLGGGPLIGYVDARGTDPSLTRANFEQSLRAVHAASVAHATHLMADRSRRRPH